MMDQVEVPSSMDTDCERFTDSQPSNPASNEMDQSPKSAEVVSPVYKVDDNPDKVVFKAPQFQMNISKTNKVVASSSVKLSNSTVKETSEKKCDTAVKGLDKDNIKNPLSTNNAPKINTTDPAVSYSPPPWSAPCSEVYSLEVLKNGIQVAQIPLQGYSWRLVGRLPSCHLPLLHPSLSRHHAILQYSEGTPDKESTGRSYPKGWYLMDLESTHGTVINKTRVPPGQYVRLYVGHVIKFAGSTRLHVVSGPDEDREAETQLSWSEMKELKERKIREREEAAQRIREREEAGCTWGMADDAIEETMENPFAELEPRNEAKFKDDPKKELKKFFDREGIEMPEYQFVDSGFGKHQCSIELPLDTEDGRPMMAEAVVSGKRRDATIACALEACRLLDRSGRLYPSGQHGEGDEVRRARQAKLEENEFYSSDEDVFLDRTGQVEEKRKMRMRKAGKLKEEEAETHTSLTIKLDDVLKEISDIEAKLEKSRQEFAVHSSASELDELDAYMNAIKSGAMDRKTRMHYKARLFELKRSEIKLQRLVNISKPTVIPGSKLITISSATQPSSSIPAAISKIKLAPLSRIFHEKKKESDDEADDQCVVRKPDGDTALDVDTLKCVTEDKDLDTLKSSESNVPTDSDKLTSEQSDPSVIILPTTSSTKEVTSNESTNDSSSTQIPTNDSASLPPAPKKSTNQKAVSHPRATLLPMTTKPRGPQLPEGWKPPTEDDESSDTMTSKGRKRKLETDSLTDVSALYDVNDPKIAVWLPPKDQAGDGKTKLNEKFGY